MGFLEGFKAHVWVVRLDVAADVLSQLERHLSPDERSKADRFVTEQLRCRYIVCRAALRKRLGEWLDCSPGELKFEYEPLGKPFLADHAVHFNVSHSEGWGMVALAPSPIGIDLELLNRHIQFTTLQRQIASSEEVRALNSMDVELKEKTLGQLWVCKEALLKSMGLGIAEGLTKITLPIPMPPGPFAPSTIDSVLQLHLHEDGTCRRNAWLQPDTWRLHWIEAVPDSLAVISTLREISEVDVHFDD